MNLNYKKIEENYLTIFEFDGDYSGKIVIEDENYDDVTFILKTSNGTYSSKFRLNPEALKEDALKIIDMIVTTSINRMEEVAAKLRDKKHPKFVLK